MRLETLPWYYAPSPLKTGEHILLTGDEWHHCSRVLRYSTGDKVILTNGQGQCVVAVMGEAGPKEGSFLVTEDASGAFPSVRNYFLSVGIAPTKNIDRTEFAVEKLTELGVDEIRFLQCRHGERQNIRMDRMEKIMISAAKQSRKIFFPQLHQMMTPLTAVTEALSEKNMNVYCCHLDEDSLPLVKNYIAGNDVMVLIGPEGGFADDELSPLLAKGAQKVTLGPFRLRVETAAIAACSQIHTLNEIHNNR